jgi:hypothetical protein
MGWGKTPCWCVTYGCNGALRHAKTVWGHKQQDGEDIGDFRPEMDDDEVDGLVEDYDEQKDNDNGNGGDGQQIPSDIDEDDNVEDDVDTEEEDEDEEEDDPVDPVSATSTPF